MSLKDCCTLVYHKRIIKSYFYQPCIRVEQPCLMELTTWDQYLTAIMNGQHLYYGEGYTFTGIEVVDGNPVITGTDRFGVRCWLYSDGRVAYPATEELSRRMGTNLSGRS